MEVTTSPFFLAPLAFAVIGLVSLALTYTKKDWPKPNRNAMIALVTPSLFYLVMFYTLAVHMHQSLGGWPTSIGDRGFPEGLVLHANLVRVCFYVLLMGTVFIWPAIFFPAVLFKVRFALPYLSIHAVSFTAAFGLMLMAPEPFLYWWWD